MEKSEKLKEQYSQYDNSAYFINCVFYAFNKSCQKEKHAVWFINNHFKQYDECDIVMMKRCAAHWNNVQRDKLNQEDFLSYKQCMHTLSMYRMVLKSMEHFVDENN
jgi:hypothetical protein